MNYLIDSNIFIQAQREYYCLDICPGFWDFLGRRLISGELASIQHVYKELTNTPDDDVAIWVKDYKQHFSTVDDEVTQKNFSAIVNYVNEEYSRRRNNNPHIAGFLSVADPWLIAKAKTLQATLVTHEVRAPGGHRPKIPDVCDKFGVATIRTSDMIRALSVRFIMEDNGHDLI